MFTVGHGPPDDTTLADAPAGAGYLDVDTGDLYLKG